MALGIPLGIATAFFTSQKLRGIYQFAAWHYKWEKVPNISEVISNQNDSLLTINLKSPNSQKMQYLIQSIEYIHKLNESVREVETKVETQFQDFGIQLEKRRVANIDKNNYEKILNQLKLWDSQKKYEIVVGLGVKSENLKNIEAIIKDPGKSASDTLNGVVSIRLPEPAHFASPLALLAADPNSLVDNVVNRVHLDAEIVKKISNWKTHLKFSTDHTQGFPAYKATSLKFPSKEIYLTLIGREYLVLASDAETFREFIKNLSKDEPPVVTRSVDEVLWARLSLEKIIESTPDKYKLFLPASARNLKFLTLTANFSENVSLDTSVDFKDASSANEAMIQLNMFKALAESKKPRDIKLRNVTDEWIKQYFSLTTKNNSIIAKIDFPLSAPRAQIVTYFQAQFSKLNQDFKNLSVVAQYMKTNKLIQIKLKDLNNPNAFSPSLFGSPTPFHVHSGAMLSATHNGQNFRPLMLVTQADCDADSKFDIQMKSKTKPAPAPMYKMHQDPKSAVPTLAFDSQVSGVQVFMMSSADFSNEWEMIFHTPVATQLGAVDTPQMKNNFINREEPRTIVKLKSDSFCQIPFEPFLIAQSQ